MSRLSPTRGPVSVRPLVRGSGSRAAPPRWSLSSLPPSSRVFVPPFPLTEIPASLTSLRAFRGLGTLFHPSKGPFFLIHPARGLILPVSSPREFIPSLLSTRSLGLPLLFGSRPAQPPARLLPPLSSTRSLVLTLPSTQDPILPFLPRWGPIQALASTSSLSLSLPDTSGFPPLVLPPQRSSRTLPSDRSFGTRPSSPRDEFSSTTPTTGPLSRPSWVGRTRPLPTSFRSLCLPLGSARSGRPPPVSSGLVSESGPLPRRRDPRPSPSVRRGLYVPTLSRRGPYLFPTCPPPVP